MRPPGDADIAERRDLRASLSSPVVSSCCSRFLRSCSCISARNSPRCCMLGCALIWGLKVHCRCRSSSCCCSSSARRRRRLLSMLVYLQGIQLLHTSCCCCCYCCCAHRSTALMATLGCNKWLQNAPAKIRNLRCHLFVPHLVRRVDLRLKRALCNKPSAAGVRRWSIKMPDLVPAALPAAPRVFAACQSASLSSRYAICVGCGLANLARTLQHLLLVPIL